ncbi:MAG: hypothetical protein OXH36_00760 [Bdellovibrionales bacterium]|nr:hypothetical protein [Bdellovibrionales bacterium]
MIQICPCCKKEFSPLSPPPPASAASVEEDMGDMFSCPHCQSVLKWDKEGSLQIIYESTEEPAVLEEPEPSSLSSAPLSEEAEEIVSPEMEIGEATPPTHLPNPEEIGENPIENPSSPPETYKEPLHDNPPEENLSFPPKRESHQEDEQGPNEGKEKKTPEEKEPAVFSTEKTEEEELQENDFNELPEESFNEEEVIQTDPAGQDFSDVEQYGNAQASSEKGFLRYDLCISGLDSSEIEKQVLHILENPRFKWDAREVLRSQKEGVLTIKNLNPIKAMCLVSDLSFLSVELSWKQYMALNAEIQQEEAQTEQD